MPNYSLVVNSQFKPFSYAELTAPLDRQELYQERLTEEYDNLSKQADVLEALGGSDLDKNSNSYIRYKSYSDALRKEADALSAHGLNSESRRRLTALRRRYNTDIVPIQAAYSKREKEADEQRVAYLHNPSLMFTRDAGSTTLDEYINNPTSGYGVINGANITAQMAGMARHLSKQIRSGKRENIDAYTYNYIEKYGLDENLIRNWQDSPTLSAMFKQVMESNGVTPKALNGSANMQNIIDKSIGYAEMGMWDAMGEDKSRIIENYGARLQAQAAKELGVYKKKKEIDQQYIPNDSNNNLINPLPLRSQQELSEKNKEIQKYIKNGYVEQDPATGQYRMTHRGFQEYRRNATLRVSVGESGSQTARVMNAETQVSNANRHFTPSRFRQFIDAQNGGKSIMDSKGNVLPGWGPNRAGNLFGKAVKQYEEGSYDTYHSTEYDRQLRSSYGTEFTAQLWAAARTKDGQKVLDSVEFDGKNGWKQRDALTSAALKGYKVTNVRYSKYGNTAILQKDGEEPVRVRIPRGINLGAETNIQTAIANADEYGMILDRGKRPMWNTDKTRFLKNPMGEIMFSNENLTPEDRAIINKYQRDALNEMESYGSQLVVPSHTEDNIYKPFAF